MQKLIGSLRPTAIRTCHCPQCVTPQVGTFARRTGTAAGNSLRSTVLTSTTIVCSSIFTAAAMIDANSKTQRRQQWDDALTVLEQEVSAVKNRNELAESMLVDPNKDLLDMATESERWPVNTGPTLGKHNLLPMNSVYTPPGCHVQGEWTPKKTAIVNISTRRLELLLLRILKHEKYTLEELLDLNTSAALLDLIPNEKPTTATSSTNAATNRTLRKWLGISTRYVGGKLRDLDLDLRRIWKAQPDLQDLADDPNDSWLTNHAARKPSHMEIQELNSRLSEIFRATDSNIGAEYLCLALVGHALSTSSTAPNLNTYNILISGLSKLKIRHAASYAIHALRRCNLRPNEATLSIILQHYTLLNDRAGFERYLGLIAGEHNGLSLARDTELDTNAEGISLLRGKTGEASKSIQLPCPTPKVFSAIIAGKLHFDGMAAALQTCRKMGTEGWGVSLDTLGVLLRDCVRRKDVAAGEQIWQVARQLQSKARAYSRRRPTTEREQIPQHVYAAMLKLYEDAGARTQSMLIRQELEHVWPGSTVSTSSRSDKLSDDTPTLHSDNNSKSSTPDASTAPAAVRSSHVAEAVHDTADNAILQEIEDDSRSEVAVSTRSLKRLPKAPSTESQFGETPVQVPSYRRRWPVGLAVHSRPGLLHDSTYVRDEQLQCLHAG